MITVNGLGSSILCQDYKLIEKLSKHYQFKYWRQDLSILTDPSQRYFLYSLSTSNDAKFNQAMTICDNLKKRIVVVCDKSNPLPQAGNYALIVERHSADTKHQLALALKLCGHSATQLDNTLAINDVPLAIEQSLASTIKEEQFAHMTGYSTAHFSKLFLKTFGTNFSDFVTLRRLEQAKLLLRENFSLKVAQIAYRCGYNDASYFSRVFKKQVGTTPAAYRKNPSLFEI